METGATFSPCRKFRYRLWRVWDDGLPQACFVLMNPSTADEVNNDPTVARCVERVHHWHDAGWPHPGFRFGGVIVVNVFAWRETDSAAMVQRHAAGEDVIGPENDHTIKTAAMRARDSRGYVICGWGKPGGLGGRGPRVLEMLKKFDCYPLAFKLNSDGSPKHPLYVAYHALPIPI